MAKNNSTAREKARAAHQAQLEREKRRQRITIWSVTGIVVVVIAVAVFFFINQQNREIPATGPAPTAANESGGLVLSSQTSFAPGADLGEVDVNDVDTPADTGEVYPESIPGNDDNHIIIYADANCVHCADFETSNAEALASYLDAGVTVEYRLVNYLDNPGTQNFSSRAANAMVCAADQAPESFTQMMGEVFGAYQTHQGQGLSNDQLKEIADQVGADINGCIDDNTYRPFVNYTSAKAQADGIGGTPSVWVNGKNWATDGADMSFEEFANSELGVAAETTNP